MSASPPPNSSFALTVAPTGNMQIVHLRGAAGMLDAEHLRQRLTELAESESPRIILDLSGLTFVNSAGLGAFVAAHRRCKERGGALCFVGPQEAVAQLLRITHLDRLVSVYPDLDAARAALAVASA